MRYVIYADGSYSAEQQRAGCAYLILTDTSFIDCDSIKVDCKNPTHAEILAVGYAIKSILKNENLTSEDVVEFNTDCAHVIEFYNKYIEQGVKSTSKNASINECVRNMIALNKKCTTRVCKVRGHKNFLNPNTVVDRLAKLARGRS